MEDNKKVLNDPLPPFIEEGVFLAAHTTFRIGGEADFFAQVDSVKQAKEAILFARERNIPIFFLGGGSNTVFRDEQHDGLVIKNRIKGIEIIKESGTEAHVKVMGGENWDDVVEFAALHGFWGIENLSAIPGTLGGALVQNIGAYGSEIKDVVLTVDVFDPETNLEKSLTLIDLKFAYRDSVFKRDTHRDLFIIAATLKLEKSAVSNISYKDLATYFEGQSVSQITLRDVREAVKEIRSKKFPDLKLFGTAGSFFKNCIVAKSVQSRIQAAYPDMPFFDLPNGQVKIPTGWILDKVCNLKGTREGNLELYENQSLVVVNTGDATSRELKNFISKIKKIVLEKIGVTLEEEVIVL